MTCLILTKNRPLWLPYAIQCARYQTYKNKEILILADGEDVRDLIPNDPAIRYYHQSNFSTVGEKRNVGCGLARGDVIAHFDDDDFSAPQRLTGQVARLVESGKCIAGYHTLRFTDGKRWWRYHLREEYVLGTTLCFFKDYWKSNNFPRKQAAEDVDFVESSHGLVVSEDAGSLMWATIWPGNTSTRAMQTAQWTEIAV